MDTPSNKRYALNNNRYALNNKRYALNDDIYNATLLPRSIVNTIVLYVGSEYIEFFAVKLGTRNCTRMFGYIGDMEYEMVNDIIDALDDNRMYFGFKIYCGRTPPGYVEEDAVHYHLIDLTAPIKNKVTIIPCEHCEYATIAAYTEHILLHRLRMGYFDNLVAINVKIDVHPHNVCSNGLVIPTGRYQFSVLNSPNPRVMIPLCSCVCFLILLGCTFLMITTTKKMKSK
jgi:hypothetical protein